MKRFHLGLLLALCLTLLAACGAANTGDTATEQQAATQAPAAEEAATAAAPPAPEATTAPSEGSGAAGEMPDLGGRQVLIGTDAAYPPFESVEEGTDAIVGFDPDLMAEIGKLINIQPEFKNAAFDTIFVALQNNEFDAVMSAATITDERKQIVDFSEPYIEVGQLVVVGANNDTIQSYEDLADGASVGVQTGTTGEEAAASEAGVPDDMLKRYQTIDLAFADLANDTIDAVVADGPTVGNYTAQPQYESKLKIVGEPFTTESYGIAVNKEDQELLSAINAALQQLKADGKIQELKDKYQIK